ncbi:hypothetical protein GCM10020331_042430 [Ectobacillus funiculus]
MPFALMPYCKHCKRSAFKKKDIQTLSYTITPEYDYKDGVSSLRGYRVEHLYEVTVLNVQKKQERCMMQRLGLELILLAI